MFDPPIKNSSSSEIFESNKNANCDPFRLQENRRFPTSAFPLISFSMPLRLDARFHNRLVGEHVAGGTRNLSNRMADDTRNAALLNPRL